MRKSPRQLRKPASAAAANRMLRFITQLWQPTSAGEAGAWGEGLAAEWLRRERNFVVVARNWRNPADEREEIDLVARDAGLLVFIEVKARAGDALVPGYYAVDRRKKRVLRRAIKAYLVRLRERPAAFRFDIVEVVLPSPETGPNPSILHFENIPLFTKHYRA